MTGVVDCRRSWAIRWLNSGGCQGVAFLATQDAAQAKIFFQETLKLHLTADEPFALVFDANDTMLRVSKVKRVTAAPYTVLGWRVPDITLQCGNWQGEESASTDLKVWNKMSRGFGTLRRVPRWRG